VSRHPIVALVTDFGTADHYVGAMKGVMLGICPDATLVDITHGVPPQDILAGALELAAAFTYFPAGTIFLAVVDPGVGSVRRAIAAEAGEYRFVSPDNGVLTLALDQLPAVRAVELTEARYALPVVSRTFEGRDRFAPAAAWLASGVALTAMGPPAGTLARVALPAVAIASDRVDGEIVRVDRFGNLISNISRHAVGALLAETDLAIRLGPLEGVKLVSTYSDVGPGELCALFGSSGHLEIAARGGSAAAATGAGRGAPVRVSGREGRTVLGTNGRILRPL
jgi:S-adenosylmethionine hydrolase